MTDPYERRVEALFESMVQSSIAQGLTREWLEKSGNLERWRADLPEHLTASDAVLHELLEKLAGLALEYGTKRDDAGMTPEADIYAKMCQQLCDLCDDLEAALAPRVSAEREEKK